MTEEIKAVPANDTEIDKLVELKKATLPVNDTKVYTSSEARQARDDAIKEIFNELSNKNAKINPNLRHEYEKMITAMKAGLQGPHKDLGAANLTPHDITKFKVTCIQVKGVAKALAAAKASENTDALRARAEIYRGLTDYKKLKGDIREMLLTKLTKTLTQMLSTANLDIQPVAKSPMMRAPARILNEKEKTFEIAVANYRSDVQGVSPVAALSNASRSTPSRGPVYLAPAAMKERYASFYPNVEAMFKLIKDIVNTTQYWRDVNGGTVPTRVAQMRSIIDEADKNIETWLKTNDPALADKHIAEQHKQVVGKLQEIVLSGKSVNLINNKDVKQFYAAVVRGNLADLEQIRDNMTEQKLSSPRMKI